MLAIERITQFDYVSIGILKNCIQREFGVEVSRIILGHSQVATTEIYAEADQELALRAIARFG